MVGHVIVLDEHTRNAVGRSRHDIGIVEADIGQRYVQTPVPVLCSRLAAQPQMPLADGCRGVACLVEEVGQGELVRADNHARVTCSHVGTFLAEGVAAGE